jgi:WD40 repeat protein
LDFKAKAMRLFLIVIAISLICGCKQRPKEIPTTTEEKKPYFYWSVDWHPSKDLFVVGGMQDTLRLFTAQNFELVKNIPYKGTITKTKWHPSQNVLAISVQDGVSKSSILNLDTNKRIELDSISTGQARAIGWNHSGELLAVGDYEGTLTFFDANGTFLKKIRTHQKSIIGLDWHPKENRIVAVGEDITLYDYESDRIDQIEDRQEKTEVLMLCVAWHPSGEFFVTGDYGDFQYQYPPLLQYWTDTGERIKSIEKSKAEYRNLTWSKDGELLATASEKIRLWNSSGDLVKEKETEHLLWGIDWKDDGRQLVATDEQGKTLFWNRDLSKVREFP